jgi:hypothetical protein
MARTARNGSRSGVTLIEIVVAVGILAFCFLPIMQFSRQNIRETQVSQEDLLARHFLIDMVERFKGASLEELKRLPASVLPTPLGNDGPVVAGDDLLNDHKALVDELRNKVATGVTAGGTNAATVTGGQKLQDLAGMMKLTRMATFREGIGGVHELRCVVRWLSAISKNERSIEYSKVVVR